MGKFLLLWEMDNTRLPKSPEKQMTIFAWLINMAREDFKCSMIDWKGLISVRAGHTIFEGTNQEIEQVITKYDPYINFTIYPSTYAKHGEEP